MYRCIYLLLLLMGVFVFSSVAIAGGSSVTKTVGITGAYDYHTLNDALTDVNAHGLADSVSLALMDSSYAEPALIFMPTKAQPFSLSIVQGGSIPPVLHVSGGGLVRAITVVNKGQFVLQNVTIAPDGSDPGKIWDAAINISSEKAGSHVIIEGGGIIGGANLHRGYELRVDSSTEVRITGCTVPPLDCSRIAIDCLKTGGSEPTSGRSLTAIPAMGITISGCKFAVAESSIAITANPGSSVTISGNEWKSGGAWHGTGVNIISGSLAMLDVSNNKFVNTRLEVTQDCPEGVSIATYATRISGNQFVTSNPTEAAMQISTHNCTVDISKEMIYCSEGYFPAGVELSMGGTGQKLHMEDDSISNVVTAIHVSDVGTFATIQMEGGLYGVTSSIVDMASAHNLSSFSVRPNRFGGRLVCSTTHLGNKPKGTLGASAQIGFNLGIHNDSGIVCSVRFDSADISGGEVGIDVHGNFKGDQALDGNVFSLVKTSYKANMINTNSSEKILSGGSIQSVGTFATGGDTGIVIRNPYLDSVVIRDNNFGVTTLGGLFTSGSSATGSVVIPSGSSGPQLFECHNNTFTGGEGFIIDTKEADRNRDTPWNFHVWTNSFSHVKSGLDVSLEADSTSDTVRIASVLIEGNTFNPDPALSAFTAIKGRGQFQLAVSYAGDACFSIIRHNTVNALSVDSAIGISWEGIANWPISAIDSNEIHVGANGSSIVSKGGYRPGNPVFGNVTFETSISGNILTGGGVVVAHSMSSTICAGNTVEVTKGPAVVGTCYDILPEGQAATRSPSGTLVGDIRFQNFKVADNMITSLGGGPGLVIGRFGESGFGHGHGHGQGDINSIVISHNQLIGSTDPASIGMLIDSLFIDSLVIDSNSVTGFGTALRTQKPCLFLHGLGESGPGISNNTMQGNVDLNLFVGTTPADTGSTGFKVSHNNFDGAGNGHSFVFSIVPLDSTSSVLTPVRMDHNTFTGFASIQDSFQNVVLSSNRDTTRKSISLKISTTRRQSADQARPVAGRQASHTFGSFPEPLEAAFTDDVFAELSGEFAVEAVDVDLRFTGNTFSGSSGSNPGKNHHAPGAIFAGNARRISTTRRQAVDRIGGKPDTTVWLHENIFSGLSGNGLMIELTNQAADSAFVDLANNTFYSCQGTGLEISSTPGTGPIVTFISGCVVKQCGNGVSIHADGIPGRSITNMNPAHEHNPLGGIQSVRSPMRSTTSTYGIPNSFTGNAGTGLLLEGNGKFEGVNFMNLSGNGGYALFNGTSGDIDVSNNWWGTTNSSEIVAMIFDHADSSALGGAPFEPFLADSLTSSTGTITGSIFNDLNKNGIRDAGEPGLAGSIVLFSQHGVVIDSATTDSLGAYSVSGIAYDSTSVYASLISIPDCSTSSHTEAGKVITFGNGSTETVNIGAYCDSYLYRTFAADQALSAKPVKMKFDKKRHLISAAPNIATGVENTFARLGKTGAGFLGLPQSSKDSAKQYAWLAYKNAADLGKLYASPHTGETYPIDSFRVIGKKSIKLKGSIKADRKKYNNIFWEQGVTFRLNLIASQLGVLPSGLGSLVLDTSFTLMGRELKGMSLSAIGDYMDSLATLWKRNGVTTQGTYDNLGEFSLKVLQRVNLAFAAGINVGNYSIDTSAVTTGDSHVAGKKNPFAVTLSGVRSASDAGIVAYVPGIVAVNAIKVPAFWDEEDANGTGVVPTVFALNQNYPNPFNPSTVLSFDLPVDAVVTLKIYNLLGQEVAALADHESLEAGHYSMPFDASSLASGVYFYRIDGQVISDDGSVSGLGAVRKMLLVR